MSFDRHLPARTNETAIADMAALELAMAGDVAQMEDALASVLALKRDTMIQSRLRPTNHKGPFVVSLPGHRTWIELGGSNHGAFHRAAPIGMLEVQLEELIKTDPRVSDELRKAAQRSSALQSAQRIIRAFLDPAVLPDRAAAMRLLRWSSVVEIIAYRVASRATAVLDSIRPAILVRGLADDPIAHAIRRRYWLVTSLMARCILIGADRGASGWLNDMGHSFTWVSWTPSRILVRERSLWLTAIGARSAASFGSAVVDRYSDRLERVRHPVDVFDALVGLVGIGLAESAARDDIARRLAKYQESIPSRDLILPRFANAALGQAVWTLRHVDAARIEAERIFLSATEPRSPFGVEDVLKIDPTDFDRTGRVFGLAILPLAVDRPREDFFPRIQVRRDSYAGLDDDAISRAINNAWIGAAPGETLQ